MRGKPGSVGRPIAPLARAIALAAVLAGVGGCDEIVFFAGDSRGPATVDGPWLGSVGEETVEMTLQQPDSTEVAGFGVIRRPGSARAFRVEGVRDETRITLLLEISVPSRGHTGVAFAHYRGRFVGPNRIEAPLGRWLRGRAHDPSSRSPDPMTRRPSSLP